MNLRKWLIPVIVAMPFMVAHAHNTSVPAIKQPSSKISKNSLTTGNKQPDASFFNSPLAFEPADNKAGSSAYVSRGQGHTMLITPERLVLSLKHSPDAKQKRDVVQVHLSGVNPHPKSKTLEPLQSKSNYFTGNDPKQWRTNVSNYARLRYEQIYPGIDLEYYGNQQQLEYDFIVSPGANPDAVQLRYSGIEQAELDAHGNLVVQTRHGKMIQKAPIIYQIIDGNKKLIDGDYVLTKKQDSKSRSASYRVGFHIASYDKTKILMIDPVVSFSTYLGGAGNDAGNGIAVDSAGRVYVTGNTEGSFPTTSGSSQTTYGGAISDVFVAKYETNGDLLYATYLGGSGIDYGLSIAADSSGNAYITGSTRSTNFPPVSPYQPANAGNSDAFISKLSPAGSFLLYSTYFGGSNTDEGRDIAVDSSKNIYITGTTSSNSNFPLSNALQTYGGPSSDAFVAKMLKPAFGEVYTLEFSTYIGGSNVDDGNAIALDSSNNVYITGSTYWVTGDFQPLFPVTQGAAQTTHGGTESYDVFVVKILGNGSAKAYSTFLGGSGFDLGKDISVDSSGNAYVTGSTRSADFPVVSAYQTSHAGSIDVFVTKVNASGSAFTYSTYLGGGGEDEGDGIDVDGFGNVYITGYTSSTTFPVANQISGTSGDVKDVFVTKLDAAASSLVYSTYMGGVGISDAGYDITVDNAGTAYITGTTNSIDFPTKNANQEVKAGGVGNVPDAFVAKIALLPPDLAITMTDSPDPVGIGAFLDYNITVTNNGPDAATGVVVVDTLPGGLSYSSSTLDQGSCTGAAQFVSCTVGTMAVSAVVNMVIKVSTSAAGSFTNNVSVAANETDSNTTNDSATVDTTAQAGAGSAPPPGGGGGGSAKGGGGGTMNLFGLMALLLLLGIRIMARARK